MVTGILTPNEGTITINDKNPNKDWKVKRELGIVEDSDEGIPELTIREFLEWIGQLRSLANNSCASQIENLSESFFLKQQLDHFIGSLSHGMKRKVAITGAFIGEPKTIILDEPTNGLDIDSVENLETLIQNHRKKGGSVLIACHDRHFLKNTCTHIVELDKGTLVSHLPLTTWLKKQEH